MKIIRCRTCPHVRTPHSNVLVCVHPKTVDRVSNPNGLRIDKPVEYIKDGFPDWCPLPNKSQKGEKE